MSDEPPILEVRDLEKHYEQESGLSRLILGRTADPVQAVDGVSFDLAPNETMGVIGESGCGKTTLVETLVGLHEPTRGTIRFKGKDMASFSRGDWKRFRRDVQMIFQDPYNSLDPKLTVLETLNEPLKIHGFQDREERIYEVLEQVELLPPENYVDRFPGQLSGGEKQRVSIGRALIIEPDLILADEPVSMLDVSTQAAILRLLSNLVDELGLSLVYISHDLSTVSYVCDDVYVMYRGTIVESAPTRTIISEPKHPYTQALISAIPIPDSESNRPRTSLSGTPTAPAGLGGGCRFRDRCPERMDICEQTPVLFPLEKDHRVKCHLYYDHEQLEGHHQDGFNNPPAGANGSRSPEAGTTTTIGGDPDI